MNSLEWRDNLVRLINCNKFVFLLIFNKFRENIRDTRDYLDIMRNGGNVIFNFDTHKFSFIPPLEHYANRYYQHPGYSSYSSYSSYSEYSNHTDSIDRKKIEAGINFEQRVTRLRFNYYIRNLPKLYLEVCQENDLKFSLQMITLCKSLIPYLLYKYNKSVNNLYKFIAKCEYGRLRTVAEKRDKILILERKKKEAESERLRQIVLKKRATLDSIITSLKQSIKMNIRLGITRSVRIKSIIVNIFESYLNEIDQLNLDSLNSQLSTQIKEMPNISFRKILNYMPDDSFRKLESLVS